MTQNPSDKPSNEPAPGAMPGGDIDEILSQASSLASELGEEVGAPEGASSAEEDVASPEGGGLESEAIDTQLEQIEQSLSQTESEVAGTGGGDEPAGEAMDYKSAAAAFGDASVGSAEPETAAPETPVQPSALDQPPSMGGRPPGGKVVQLGKRKPEQPAPAAEAADSTESPGIEFSEEDFSAVSDGASCPTLDDPADSGRKPARSLERPAAPIANEDATPLPASVGAVCAALGIIDRPFRRIGWKPRRLIGWLALATLFAAFAVFVLSFFQ